MWVATLLVDRRLRVAGFCQRAGELLGLVAGDEHRPINRFTRSLAGPGLAEDIAAVVRNGVALDREVVARASGTSYSVHIQPLPQLGSAVGGEAVGAAAVITFVESTLVRHGLMLQAVIDALAEHIAVVDAEGNIELVNAAWVEFARANGDPHLARSGPGTNYFSACRDVTGPDADVAQAAAAGLRRVLDGSIPSMSLEYPCHSPDRQRWFVMSAHRIGGSRGGAVISHLNVTVEHSALYDPLTGAPTRRRLMDRLDSEIAQAARLGGELALLHLDVDDFQEVNDNLGHDGGDLFLRGLAGRMRAVLPASAVVGRLGSDEFAVILPQATRRVAAEMAALLSTALRTPFELSATSVQATVSIGIAHYPGDAQDARSLLRRADAAMREVKRDGRDAWRFFDAGVSATRARRAAISRGLRSALAAQEFELHFQPQLDAIDGRLRGVEALLRWHNPELGDPGPAEFIPVAESAGAILPIGQWVLAAAVEQVAQWREAGMAPVTLAVNISGRHFAQPGFPRMVRTELSRWSWPSNLLELEITEHWAMRQREASIAAMGSLHRQGVRFALDDFGTGYSSLANLRLFPIDTIKVDRSFIAQLDADSNARALVRGMIELAHSLHLGTVAEGVQTAEQADFLAESHCRTVQGFLYAAPMPAAEFWQWYQATNNPRGSGPSSR